MIRKRTGLIFSSVLILLVKADQFSAAFQEKETLPLIPYQDITQDDIKRFPPDLLRELREKEHYWGEVLLEHRKQYESYYRDILGPGMYSTWDVYQKEMELMAEPSYRRFQAPVIERKTLTRFPDRVSIGAERLTEILERKIDQLRLLSYRFGWIHVVPFDIHEGTKEGEKIFTHGPENNAIMADGTFNHTDQLVFMAHDSGDKIDKKYILKQYGEEVLPIEIELVEPSTRAKGWVYLTYFPQSPPAKSAFDYITFLNDTVNQQFTDYVWHQSTFSFHKDKVYRKIFCRGWKYAPYFGCTGEELVDRLKARISARLWFGMMKINITEDDVIGDWSAWTDGQVVAIGRGWVAVKLPLGLRSPILRFDIVASETVLSVPIEVHVPFNPGMLLTDYTMYVGTDWHTGRYEPGVDNGFRFFNSNNRDGVVVDGVMSDREKKWNTAKDEWRLITGPAGTIGFRSCWDPFYTTQAEIWVTYMDDITKPDPPEFHPGQVAMHYSYSRVKTMDPRDYHMLMDWYGPPHFWDPDQEKLNWKLFSQYLEILDHPIEFIIGGKTGRNPTPGLRYRATGGPEADKGDGRELDLGTSAAPLR